MMTKNSIPIFFLILGFLLNSCGTTRQQRLDYVLPLDFEYHIEGEDFSLMDIDQVGNMYVVKNQRTLYKYNPDGILDKTFDSQLGGFIYSIDVSNPLYLLVYYRDATKIMLFDRNLAPLKEIDISRWTKNDITAVSLSNNNQLWLYDAIDRKLLRYNIEGGRTLESSDLYGVTSLELSIKDIREYNNQVFLRNEQGQIIVLDNLGRFMYDVDVESGLPLHGQGDGICFPKGDGYGCLIKGDFGLNYEEQVAELDFNASRVLVYLGRIYLETEGGVLVKRE